MQWVKPEEIGPALDSSHNMQTKTNNVSIQFAYDVNVACNKQAVVAYIIYAGLTILAISRLPTLHSVNKTSNGLGHATPSKQTVDGSLNGLTRKLAMITMLPP